MNVACIIGWPASKSLSPVIHNAAFRACGLDWEYRAVDVAPAELERMMAEVRAIPVAGMNVTMPHKQTVMSHLDDVSPEALAIGAVNTVVVRDGRFVERDLALNPAGVRVLILGAGGAARALARRLSQAGARVLVAARRSEAAAEIAAETGASARGWEATAEAADEADLIVNATPVGMVHSGIPIDPDAIASRHVVVDLVYSPSSTPLLDAARARGASAHNGFGMLVHQAALSFEMWTGVAAPLETMVAAAGRAL